MRTLRFTAIASLLVSLTAITAPASASIVRTFVFNDLSAWTSVSNFAVGDSITFKFADTTNFNSVKTSNIEGFGYNLAAGATQFYDLASYMTPAGNGGDLSAAFRLIGGNLTLTYANAYMGYIQATKNSQFAQFVPGQMTQAYVVLDVGGQTAMLNGLSRSVTYSAAAAEVPEPTTLALMSVALLGLGLSRRARARQG